MKKSLSATIGILLTVLLVTIMGLSAPSVSRAAETTFSGTVSDKTTSEILYLSTSGGTMEIKIDSNTSISGTKLVLPGNTINCSCYRGSDEYWHVSSISGSSQVGKVTLDASTKTTVTGRIVKGTSEELLYLVIDNGTMQIKMDDDTNLDEVTMLIIGKKVKVVVERGSDAYMHAISISDAEKTSSSSVTTNNSSSSSSGTSVSGTVEKGTTSSVLYLSTSAGTMEFVLDLGTDASACRVLLPGQKISVGYYRGTDAWNHTSKLVNNSDSASATASLDPSTQATVTGTVDEDTDEGTLYLDTNDGMMEIRLDSNTNFSKCPVLLLDKSVTVVAQRGSDAYYHAVTITSNY
ncbi:hypothetical protein SAMN04487928_12149 [Butyrivibrio proteoclasticus]|uniref:Uncharacterized protein n=1 Tax=Butyrivibrio proteoclasticus TaxID=43305 RepID=A0A1I5WBA6_9FIRM|nr:hypothetical protein [Butyrivibrio proteoclasticus]SFQ16576.1 hypothetical protein SAMN04487928_12149 [Butyrivibrio proteoclasticus]